MSAVSGVVLPDRLYEDLGGLKALMGAANAKMDAFSAEIASLRSHVEECAVKIESVRAADERVEGRLDALEKRLETVEHRVDSIIALRNRAGGMLFLAGGVVAALFHGWDTIRRFLDWLLAGHS